MIRRFLQRFNPVVRVRMALGIVLMVCTLLATHLPERERVFDTPFFGYEERYLQPALLADRLTYPSIPMQQDREPFSVVLNESVFLPPPNVVPQTLTRMQITPEYFAQLTDFEYVRTRLFLEDPSTMLLPGDIDVYEFLNADLRIDPSLPGPHVLIFHTHSTEWFVDTTDDPMTGIMGVGAYLAQLLAREYGLEVLHYTGRFDIVEGRPLISGAYERMEPVITQLLADNPQIQLVIDLHRDGVVEGGGPFTRYLDGVPTARLMFFNGLSRRNIDGEPVPVLWLPNPYQRENLQFSFQAQIAANQLFPDFNRRVYLRAYRFSLHMHPRSIFVEVGNQYNTLQEAKNAMHPLARILAEVLLAY
jgi:stage II sporulation protein P